MVAFCGSGLEGRGVKSSWYNRSSSICSAVQLHSNKPDQAGGVFKLRHLLTH